MTLHIPTRALVDFLGDLTHTAGGDGRPTDAVLLHTARGYLYPDSPGRSTLLVGTSTNTKCAGHTWVGADGDLPPTLWPIEHVKAVVAVYKPLSRQDGHEVQIRLDAGEVTVAENPNMFGDGQSFTFTAGPLDKYPRLTWELLQRPGQNDTPVQPRTDIYPAYLAPFVKVATRRNEAILLFRYHQQARLLVQIGTRYRGWVAVEDWGTDRDEDAGREPGADLYPPDLPAPAKEGKAA